MTKIRIRIATALFLLALAATPAVASDRDLRSDVRLLFVDQVPYHASHVTADADPTLSGTPPLLLDQEPQVAPYSDHPYLCADGNCTDW